MIHPIVISKIGKTYRRRYLRRYKRWEVLRAFRKGYHAASNYRFGSWQNGQMAKVSPGGNA